MKKISYGLVAFAVALIAVSCGAKVNYDDVKAAMDKESSTITTFASGVDAASDAAGLASVISTFVDNYKTDNDALAASLAKHTEATGKDVPAELQTSFKALTDANTASAAAITKIMNSPLATDPAVIDALTKMQALQASMAK